MKGTPINSDTLVSAGYRYFEAPPHMKCSCLYQRDYRDQRGTLYFLTFRQWPAIEGSHIEVSFDAEISTDLPNNGHVWITIRAPTIEKTEAVAAALWIAAGANYYEVIA
jgi:hypothetical protein